jgi:formate-dependent nitrite reductase cytochrome c552 subunit
MEFSGCVASGCHNFHDNRSLYTRFLIKHLDEPDLLDEPQVPSREFAAMLDQIPGYPHEDYPVQPLAATDADAPPAEQQESLLAGWAASAHARSGVNCTACHQPEFATGGPTQWNDHPDAEICAQCHELEVERYGKGRHGMRLAVGLAPLRVSEARLPMKEDAAHEALGCNSCHGAHRYDTRRAAAAACQECHNDTHTLAYRDSPHRELWRRELRGELAPGGGVSCATCHLPRIEYDVNDWLARIMVDHNQSANLAPNSKMIRSVCLQCHGLEFSIDALADQHLIDTNFNGRPAVHVETMDLAAAEKERRASEAGEDADTSMFGF